MIKLFFKSLLKRKISFIMTCMLSVIAFSLIIVSLYLYVDDIYSEGIVNELIYGDESNTLLYNYINYEKKISSDSSHREFTKEIMDLDEVRSVGIIEPSKTSSLIFGELGNKIENIQKNSKYLEYEEGTCYDILMTNSCWKLCDLDLLSGEIVYDKNQPDNTNYIYLGYNLRNIAKVGDEYTVELPNGTIVKSIVKGSIKKGEKIINTGYFYNSSNESGALYCNLDDIFIMQFPEIIMQGGIISLKKNTDILNIQDKLYDLGKKYNFYLSSETCKEIRNEKQKENADINNMIYDLMLLIFIMSIFITTITQITEIYRNKSEYGIFYAMGFSKKSIGFKILIENMIKFIFSGAISIIVTYRYIFSFYFNNNNNTRFILNEMYWRYLIPIISFVIVVTVILSSVGPILIVFRQNPVDMIGENDT